MISFPREALTMAEFFMLKGERVEIPVDVIEVGREAVAAYCITLETGKTVPTELLSATDAETAKASQPESVKAAADARNARLARIAAWAKPVVEAAEAAKATKSAKKGATDRGEAPQEK